MDWKTGDQGHLRAPEDTDPKSLCSLTFLAVKQCLFISYLRMRGTLLKNMGCLEANDDSPVTEHRQGLLILRAGEIAKKGCQVLLHV